MEWCYGCYFKKLPKVSLLKTFVENHRQNPASACRYRFDKEVVQTIAIDAVLSLVLAIAVVTSLSIFLKNIKLVLLSVSVLAKENFFAKLAPVVEKMFLSLLTSSTAFSSTVFNCSQTKSVAIILVLSSYFHAIFCLTNFSSDAFDFSTSKTR